MTTDVNTTTARAADSDRIRGHQWRLLIGGDLRPAASGAAYPVINPTSEAPLVSVPDGDQRDVDAAVTAARAAHAAWRGLPAAERGARVATMADRIDDHAEELAVLDSLCGGAPIGEMRSDVHRAAAVLRYFAGLARELKGETVPASAANLHLTTREPFGLVARIIPFNHPAMFAAGKIAAPLVAGNCVLLKPPEIAPLSALRMGELFADVLPAGVLSIVVGDGPTVPRALVRHPAVTRIGFIGSEPTGRSIQRDAADTGVKTVTLELGGKNALVAFPDADPAAVAAGVIRGMNFTWGGQSCGSTSRLLAHEDIADDLVERIAATLRDWRIGDPLDPATQMGPLASRAQYDKALRYIQLARDEGATVVTGGARPAGRSTGFFVEPTVLDGVRPDMRVAQEEIFGPVLSVIRWRDEADAVATANAVAYGLTASVWTNDLGRAHRTARALDAGYVWINGSSQHFLGLPFGGVKASGVGREESMDELLSYTQPKAVTVMLG